jgi:uncharacterized protein
MHPQPSGGTAGLPAEVRETHVSTIVLLGDRAYKVKKPVSFGFVDFSTRALREQACHREVELNRRLAPDVYLGVADVVFPPGSVCEHAVVMRRMPAERRLSTLAVAGADLGDEIAAVARQVAALHAGAERSAAIDRAATPARIRANWNQSFEQMAPFAGILLDPEVADRVATLARRWLDGREPLLRRRISDGRICDGHGDLLADDIFCLDDGPRVLDCLEFADHLRHVDVVADVAFLAMDLERLGRPDLARRFLTVYAELSGEGHPRSLLDHYVAQRACVRSKVACLRWEGGDHHAAADAETLLELARQHLERARVRLVLVGGVPGAGKSTLAEGLGSRLGWTVLRSDEVRKAQAGLDPLTPAPAAFRRGLYSPETTERVYAALLEQAGVALGHGESVVLDASWTSATWRARARRVAHDTAGDVVELRCHAPRAIAAARVSTRGADASDATPAVSAALEALADDWPEAGVVDTSGPVDHAVSRGLRLVAPEADDELAGATGPRPGG